jgi:hypothetical protein
MNFQPGPAEPTPAAQPTAPGAAPGLIQRVIMVFTSPTNLGEALRGTPPWFWTLAIVAIVAALIVLFIPADLLRATMEAQAQGRQQGQEAPDPETMLMIGRLSGTGGALLGTFIGAFVTAGALYLAFNVMVGQDTTYKHHLSATAHVWWISLLGSLVVLPIWIAKGDMVTKLGLGLLLQDSPETFVGHFLNGITLFGLWAGAALGAVESGLSGGRVTVGKGIGMVLVLYLIWVVFQAALATIFGGFGG